MKNKNVLYVFCSQNFSGAEIVIERLITSNPQINSFAICPPGLFADRLKKKNIKVYENNYLSSLERGKNSYSKFNLFLRLVFKYINITKEIFKLIKSEDISIVHSNNLAASVYLIPSVIISKLIARKVKWIWSNQDITYSDGKTGQFLANLCILVFDRTITASNAVRNKFPFFRCKTTTIYAGLDTYYFRFSETSREKFRKQHNLSSQSTLIGIVGVISNGKGHHLLVNSIKNLLKEFPHIVLVIVGPFSPVEKSYKNTINNLISTLPSCNYILIGQTDNILEVYSGIDILVNATLQIRKEPLGTTIYEAMSCERLVLASNTGGSPEIISDCIDGLLFEADSESDLTRKLRDLVVNYKHLNSMRHLARIKVLSLFDIRSMVNSYNQTLNQLK